MQMRSLTSLRVEGGDETHEVECVIFEEGHALLLQLQLLQTRGTNDEDRRDAVEREGVAIVSQKRNKAQTCD